MWTPYLLYLLIVALHPLQVSYLSHILCLIGLDHSKIFNFIALKYLPKSINHNIIYQNLRLLCHCNNFREFKKHTF